VGAGGDDLTMKKSLRRGKYSILNLYFQTDLAGSVLGKCTLLSSIGPGTTNSSFYANDRCSVQAGTMPGGTVDGYNEGMIAVHEKGH
jgi:hypothetical protein